MRFDPYHILGVSRETGPADWKRAYRKLAMRWHPDRNDHPEATERFKEIRAAYDHLAAIDVDEDEPMPEEDYPPENPVKAADIRLSLEISLDEAVHGCRKSIHYSRGNACPTCDGSGESGMSRTRFCECCHGSGRVRDAERTLAACEECGGRGFFTQRICPDCDGSGREMADVSIEVTVPPGMLPGDDLRVLGQGEPATGRLQAGDLYLTLLIHSHPLFARVERDLHFSMPVSALAMIAGGEIELPSMSGMLRHQLDAGAAEVRELRLKGKGFPGRGKMPAGDLVVSLQPVFPQLLNARQRKLLLQANAALMADSADSLPDVSVWRREYGLD